MGRKKSWKDQLKVEDDSKPDWKAVRDAIEPVKHRSSASHEEPKKELKTKTLEAKTENQKHYMKIVRECTVTFCSGVAGTGKTYIACGIGAQMLMDNKINRIIISRPIVECGHRLGFLPGDLHEKTDPYMNPMFESLGDFIDPVSLKKLLTDKVIESVPLETMRGRTFHNSLMILDEAQNVTKTQMKMFLTRMGKDSKVVICGDTNQSDLTHQDINPLRWAMALLDHDQIGKVVLTEADIQRHGLISYILTALGN
jgi:phosphate starvation-inducible PhoH-like protein